MFYSDRNGKRYRSSLNKTKSSTISAIDIETGELVSNLESMDDLKTLETMKTKVLPSIYNDQFAIDNMSSVLDERLLVAQNAASVFWRMVENNKDAILNYGVTKSANSDLIQMFQDETMEDQIKPDDIPTPGAGSGTNQNPRYKLNVDRSDNDEMAWIREIHTKSRSYGTGGYCGQWICAFIVGAYNYKDIPYYSISTEIGEGPMRLTDIDRVMQRYSHYYLTTDYIGRNHWDTYWHIREGKPVLKLTSAGTHWTLLYGSYRIKRWIGDSYYFMQIDNGTMIGSDRTYRSPYDSGSYNECGFVDLFYFVND